MRRIVVGQHGHVQVVEHLENLWSQPAFLPAMRRGVLVAVVLTSVVAIALFYYHSMSHVIIYHPCFS